MMYKESNILEVTGKGKVVVSPTITKIDIKFNDCLNTYKEALNASVRDVKEVRKIFTSLGFDTKDIKTTMFDIRTKYEDDYNTKQKHVFKGYEYNQGLVIRFKNDNTLLSKVLAKLSNALSSPMFTISYEIENKEEIKAQAITKAVEDAKFKANIIATASDINLLDISEINYGEKGYGRYDLRMYDCNMVDCCEAPYSASDFNVDFNPQDLIIEEEVHMIWHIDK